MAKQQLRRYIWLIDTIRGTDGITFEEINQRWMRSSLNEDGKELPKRTFHDHIDGILEEFDIEIICDRCDGYKYRIEELDEYGSIRGSLVDALVLENAVKDDPEIRDRIIFHDYSHRGNLPVVVQALKEKKVINFHYLHDYSYSRKKVPGCEHLPDTNHTDEIAIYGLFFCGIWFMVGEVLSDHKLHIYALHRLSEIQMMDKEFSLPEGFDVKEYMTNYKEIISVTAKDAPSLEDDGSSLAIYLTDAQQAFLL